MKSITYTAIRANLAKQMDQVCEDHAPILITRTKAGPVVMMSLEDYEAIQETNYLLRSPVNAARLADAIDEIESMVAKKKKKKKTKKKK